MSGVRTAEIDQEIVERIAKGEPLAVICRDEHMPSDRAVRYWQEDDAEFASAIARARESGFDAIAAECLDIADGENGDDVQRAKLRVETRLKLLAKWDPKRYGDLVKVAGADGGPVQAAVTISFRKTDAPDGD